MLAKRGHGTVSSRHLFFCRFQSSIGVASTSCSKAVIGSRSPQKTSSSTVFCNTQITKHGRNGNIKEAESIFSCMPCKSVVSWTAMLTAYAENGQIGKARKVFDEMPERNAASWNAMITAYIRDNLRVKEASLLFGVMPERERNAVSYGAMITGYVKGGMVDEAENLYAEMPLTWRDPIGSNALISGYLKMGDFTEAIRVFEGMKKKDVVSWGSMIDGYCKKGSIADARELFERMPNRNVVTWTAMINGYMKIGCSNDGFEMFLRLRRDECAEINSTTLTVMFEGCGNSLRFREGIQIHGLSLHMGFEFDVFLGNSIINMYCRFGCMEAATRTFNLMSKRDVVSWNSLISGYVESGEVERAYSYLEKMPGKDVVSWTAVISGFSSKGNIEKSISLFEEMPVKDDIAWTAIISGFVNNGEYEQSIRWFIQMAQKGIKPNPLTLSSILSAAGSLVALNQGLQFHACAVKMDMEYDVSIQNSLVSMYSKCGHIPEACKVFRDTQARNVVSYNSMITGFAQNGFASEALAMFEEMQDRSICPNQITFLGVLSACAHMGLVEEGWSYFNSMKSTYGIEPEPDHFACMVDLLGRAGQLDEAINLIRGMPCLPHSGVWGALLGASRKHSHLDLAMLAAKHLFELEPHNAIPYVVLSDVYSAMGLKKDEENLRIAKKLNRIRKTPGCSWIIVKDEVHLFFAQDQSHKAIEEIEATLLMIAEEMR